MTMNWKKNSFCKGALLSAAFLAMNLSANATVYEPGQQVSDFVVNEDYGLTTAPSLTTDDSLANWAYGSYNDGNVIAYTDQRGWRAVFEINAPAEGKYGVEVKVRTTTTNWMVAFTSSQSLDLSDRASITAAPEWTNMARPTKISTVSQDTIVISEAQGNPGDEDYVPAVTELRQKFATGEWETIYVPVDLKAGHNYVTFWLCRTYQGIDNLTGPEGTPNGFYVQAIKVMPQGSGDVASVLQTATLRLWEMRMYPTIAVEGNASLPTDYTSLLQSYGTATDYASLSTTAVQNGITATNERVEDLRHGRGVILNSDSVAFALPYYYDLQGGSISENERGEYSDAPMVFEYTNGKTLVYKFTSTVAGTFYPMLYAGTQLSTYCHINVYDDNQNYLVKDYKFIPNTGAWQIYQMWSQPAVSSFEVEANKTYYISLYFENYVNVRGLYLLQVVQKPKTYAELDALKAEAETVYAQYQPGTDGYYSLEDTSLITTLEEAIANAADLDESSSSEEITAAYYALQDILEKISAANKINVIPTTESNPFNLPLGTFSSWRVESAGNIGYGYANGSVTYTVYNKKDANYNLNIALSNQATDISVLSAYIDCDLDSENTVRVADISGEFTGTGSWNVKDTSAIQNIPIPEGRVKITIFGTQAASNGFVGNIFSFDFQPIAGTEGKGAEALKTATEAYYALYTEANLQALIEQAREAITLYPYPTYDQSQVESVNKAIQNALDAIASGKIGSRAAAYKKLQTAIDNLAKSVKISWITIPTTDEAPFDLSVGTFNRWRMESGGNIGYGYQGGSVLYYINVPEADTYDMAITMSNPADGAQIRVTASSAEIGDTTVYSDVVYDVPNTGDWNTHQDVVAKLTLPKGLAKVLLYGEAAAGNWVGNIYAIKVTKGDPTGISEINTNANFQTGRIYTISGQYVGTDIRTLGRGIYITNGKKVVIR